jgi:peroxiredoxin
VRRLAIQVVTFAVIFAAIWALRGGPPFPMPWAGGGEESQDFFTLGPTGNVRGRGPGLGQPAPDFALENADGDVVRLTDFRGKTVVVNFWATWCTPCRKEFPELVKLHEGSTDVVIIGVNLQENANQVRDFAEEFGAQFPIVIDADGTVAESYRLLGLPSTYFVDPEGVLREQHFGQLSGKIIEEKVATTRTASASAAE